MSAVLEVLDPGFFVTLQDGGRKGFRNIGVPLAGALDPVWLAAANALAGNPVDAPGLEVRLAGPTLRLKEGGPVRLALVGAMTGEVTTAEGAKRPVAANAAVTLKPGDTFKAGRATGTAYIAVSGGFLGDADLGSYSTFERARLGGIKGRAPQRGDLIACRALAASAGGDLCAEAPPAHARGPIRIMLGPQDDHFEPETLQAFCRDTYTVSPSLDRMGMRLEGPVLTHNALGADIVSDGVTPGVIQCPANGQPIILLADGQTTGGYAKIACAIRADLPRLAHLRPGDTLHFAAVTRDEAKAARQAAQAVFTQWVCTLAPVRPEGPPDSVMLLSHNLISGVTAGEDESV
ncbi:MAG: biotin-dependent carboxyltransferase family protein [Proteobacteria bacterium]|nr:biotin-dependent carboxyltransferase family protein [Pseudomonadota bacterium]